MITPLNDIIAPWIVASFPIIRMVLMALIAASSIILIIAILSSPATAGRGSNAITGASESYYTKHKGKSNQGRIRNLVIIMAGSIAFFALLYFITWIIFPNVPA